MVRSSESARSVHKPTGKKTYAMPVCTGGRSRSRSDALTFRENFRPLTPGLLHRQATTTMVRENVQRGAVSTTSSARTPHWEVGAETVIVQAGAEIEAHVCCIEPLGSGTPLCRPCVAASAVNCSSRCCTRCSIVQLTHSFQPNPHTCCCTTSEPTIQQQSRPALVCRAPKIYPVNIGAKPPGATAQSLPT